MKKSEAPISGHVDPATRLTALLRKILDDVGRSVNVLKEAVEGSQLPFVQGDDGDIELAAMYLRDLGFPNDGERLHREYLRLCNKCIDEWLVAMADGESQELHRDQLIELFGQFPRSEGPSDPNVANRKVANLGFAVQFSDYLSGLISSVNASEKRRPSGTPEGGLHGEPPTPDPTTPKCTLEKCKPSELKAYYSYKLAEERAERRLEDREAYDLLDELLADEDSIEQFTGELTDYKLPSFGTWSRQLRTARSATKERKYTPRTHK
jgi:hypothetical protein